ncbi:uncharacterized protein LOC119080340 [Bradysia coprophila]|uniref:uncharacterized protein LOC119080340 n=1 Tax=Bradysia coprophila TaxID=38358 RepID=UPI00187D736D|nr:uncharacterized protein LOC119080340 [Bradysia coprophila]XP_037044531.1 uncharacterized protein LOC119080340 [Bradysia coprophila]
MENQVVEIDCEKWIDLRALYLPESTETILGLSTLNNFIKWNDKESPIPNLTIYSLNGDWSDGTFVLIDRYHIYCDTLNKSTERLKLLLDLMDYSKGIIVMHVRSKCYPAISDIFTQRKFDLEFDHPNCLYYLPKEEAIVLDVQLPEGFDSRPLSQSDVVKANAAWEFRHPGSLFYLQRLARLNISYGIFDKENNEMISSGFQTQTGPLGTIYTNPKYRNRGFGTFVAKIIFKKIGESGQGVIACVKEMNVASRAIFEKIGCQVIDRVHWISLAKCDWTDETDLELK